MSYRNRTTGPADEARESFIAARLAELTLEEKVQLLTGGDFWNTVPLERIGLRNMLLSDGPSGVRGELWDERLPSVCLPSASLLAATWDRSLAHDYGRVLASEARGKGVDVVLGPTINLHRSPLAGRHFEAFSEDPTLTGALAEAYVHGVQSGGVAATPKHYVANDSETDRFDVDVVVADRTLRELYLAPFERCVRGAHAWAVMSAYNAVNGHTITESPLLETPLDTEWGFDGVVISDWSAVRSLESANYGQDLVMPGPEGPWGQALVEAVRAGEVPESAIDRKVLRILRLAARVGALTGAPGGTQPEIAPLPAPAEASAIARTIAADGMVLLQNDDVLPLSTQTTKRIAVIGDNAARGRIQGGGSATVVPAQIMTPLDGVRAAFPNSEVSYSVGAITNEGLQPFPLERITNPVTGHRGLHVRFLDDDGRELFTEERFATHLVYFGGDAPVSTATRLEFTTTFTAIADAQLDIGVSSIGYARIYIDGTLRAERLLLPEGRDLGAAFSTVRPVLARVDALAGVPVDLRIDFEPRSTTGEPVTAMALTIGIAPPEMSADDLIARASEDAARADVAVVVVGTNERVESEGFDRESLRLPGEQDRLVEAVLDANPNTIVVINAGAPVEMPWRDRTRAILLSYFPGQEFGTALADVLTGVAEPGGRLPTTWPARQEDAPVTIVEPTEHQLHYTEGLHIGHRAWLRAESSPAYWFGHGLGYTSWRLNEPVVTESEDGWTLTAILDNTGSRPGKQIVQVYAERPGSTVDRPARWLVGFAIGRIAGGTSEPVSITIPRRALAHWDDGWQLEPGTFTLAVGTSANDIAFRVELDCQ